MKKRFAILLMTMCMVFGTVTVQAATQSECPYKSTHGQHSPHASNFECKMYTFPDYSMGQMHLIAFWKCKGCTYCCCAIDEYFGNLLRSVPEENVVE